ncbi:MULTISPECIES: cytochrome c oxidase subunit 3 family protein [unclassified Frankia]|uniref:cytochrome c oxidase subunit 3 family protein n=1 Tax=unclassified Frankia TaxID=2632575 RepID=UPI00202593BF
MSVPSGMDPFVDPFASRTARAPQWRPRGGGRVPGEIGIWVFIFGDMLVFGLFFGVFVHERSRSTELFEQAHETMNLTFGAVNTLLLLTGSMFVVLGLSALRGGASRPGSRMILVTLLCGAGFVLNKYLEYSDKIDAGHTPSANSFYMYYFVFTGIHLLHLLIGMIGLVIMYRIARKPVLEARDIRNLEAGACYWHLVDLLWIVLFALLYLMR